MANVYIGSDYTITDVNMCNTASDAQVWYQVSFKESSRESSIMYTTPYNDAKFPKNLSKTNFIANVLPEINTYISVLNGGTYSALADWDTEA
tara:strand:+ start:210 stop:485 length:276 start_codon:yes stop_codon:yes gene_type:complete